jgi:hypothetical protein
MEATTYLKDENQTCNWQSSCIPVVHIIKLKKFICYNTNKHALLVMKNRAETCKLRKNPQITSIIWILLLHQSVKHEHHRVITASSEEKHNYTSIGKYRTKQKNIDLWKQNSWIRIKAKPIKTKRENITAEPSTSRISEAVRRPSEKTNLQIKIKKIRAMSG